MSRWFRHYAGMMRDDKLVSAAIKSKQPVERVVWVWGAILESAAEIDDDGLFRFDTAEAAYFLRADEADICAVVDALTAAGRLASNRVVNWSARQFKSDRSAERQARYRNSKRQSVRDGDNQPASPEPIVTSPSRHGDAPEAETETETEKQKPRVLPFDRLIEAASANGGCHPNLVQSIAQILAYLDKGYDLERDILPVVRGKASPSIRTWKYFGAIIEANAEQKRTIPSRAPEPEIDWAARMDVWRRDDYWPPAWGPKPGARNCKVPAQFLEQEHAA